MTKVKALPVLKGGKRSKEAMEEREDLFVEAYVANGKRGDLAAIAAGYAKSNAKTQAVKMLARPRVIVALRERREALAQKFRLDTESVIEELAKIVHSDPRKLFDAGGNLMHPKDWPDEMAGAVASIEVDELFDCTGKNRKLIGYTRKVKLWDKNSGIDKAMKHLGLFAEDNKQRMGALAHLPREVLQLIVAHLQGQPGGKVINGQFTRA